MQWSWSAELTNAPWYVSGRAIVISVWRWRIVVLRVPPKGTGACRFVIRRRAPKVAEVKPAVANPNNAG